MQPILITPLSPQAKTIPEGTLYLPLKVTSLDKGYSFAVWRVYLVGRDFLIYSRIGGAAQEKILTALYKELFIPNNGELDPSKKYRTVHFIDPHETAFEHTPQNEPFLTLPVKNEEEFFLHVIGASKSEQYIDKLCTPEEPEPPPPPPPQNSWSQKGLVARIKSFLRL